MLTERFDRVLGVNQTRAVELAMQFDRLDLVPGPDQIDDLLWRTARPSTAGSRRSEVHLLEEEGDLGLERGEPRVHVRGVVCHDP